MLPRDMNRINENGEALSRLGFCTLAAGRSPVSHVQRAQDQPRPRCFPREDDAVSSSVNLCASTSLNAWKAPPMTRQGDDRRT